MIFRSKYFIPLVLVCAAVLVAGVLFSSVPSKSNQNTGSTLTNEGNGNQDNNPANGGSACPQDAKVCPDGSSVGRVGPNCEFAPCPTMATTTPVALGKIYETDFLKVTIPDGWTAAEANQTTYVPSGTGSDKPVISPNPAAVNITQGNYILYINAQAQQASGVEGGRFAEISMGAPSADAVVIYQPGGPCGTSEKYPAFGDHQRYDWYLSKTDRHAEDCAAYAGDAPVWYFSYVSKTGGYINYYTAGNPPGYVMTMAYNSKDITAFPKKGSPELERALSDMTTIVNSLVLKYKAQ